MAEKEEFDITDIVWKCYEIMYKGNFSNKFTIINKNAKRAHIEASFEFKNKKSKKLNFSGETDFNFKRGFSYSIHCRYKKLLEEEKNIDNAMHDTYLKQLEDCKSLMYSIANISLMPQTGALQLAKAGIGNDRLDRFVWALNKYYEEDINLLTCRSSYENINVLKSFLGLFDSAAEYCNAIYHIDTELVNKMIELGKVDIDTAERVIMYMDLAFQFWQQKVTFLQKQDGISPKIRDELKKLNKMMSNFKTSN